MGGTVKVNEKLHARTLDFRKDKSGLYMLIDSNEIFHFSFNGGQNRIGNTGLLIKSHNQLPSLGQFLSVFL